ncbi:hypothetical protein V12B01_13435 [Vibrio splendidus 12B01]|nr:hypothetical protein V12B01_13435 [Vibrio splendidus 12B01]
MQRSNVTYQPLFLIKIQTIQ